MLNLNCLLLIAVVFVPTDKLTNDQIRATVQRSIPYIQERGTWWIEEKKCVSCHRVSTMVWSLSAAQRKGFYVSDELEQWRTWSIESSLATNDNGSVDGLVNKEGVAQILLSLDGINDQTAVRKQLAALLWDGQQPDGSWKPCGQLPMQNRPMSETACVSTMWLTLALENQVQNNETVPELDSAWKYIRESNSGKSTEWYALKLLLAARENDQATQEKFVTELLKQQQADGGWGWLVGDRSDALGTGMALYSLIHAGVKHDDPHIMQAQQFLVQTQRDDGSWEVHGTKVTAKDRVEETAVYWGTTWAALGLIASLPTESQEDR